MPNALMALVEQRAGSYFAGLSHLSEDAQLAAVRRVMLSDVDRLEAELLAQVELIRDCLLLAANSMQDARLALLEQELAKVQTPEPKQMGEFIIEAVLTLAMELGVLFMPYAAAAVVPLIASRRATIRELERSLVSLGDAKTGAEASRAAIWPSVSELSRRATAQEAARSQLTGSFAQTSHSLTMDALSKRAEALSEAEGSVANFSAMLVETRNQYYAAVTGDLTPAEKMVAAFITNDVQSDAPVAKLAGKMRATSESRIGQSLGAALVSTSTPGKASGAQSQPTVYFTSDVLGRQLDACRSRTLLVRLAMASLRSAVAGVSWDELLEDAMWQQRVTDLCTAPAWLSAHRSASGLAQPAIIRSAEALLWYEWLSVTGALTVDAAAVYTHVTKGFGTGSPGTPGPNRAVGPYWIVKPVGESRGTGAAGVHSVFEQDFAAHYYPGLTTLTEAQAAYLHERFARLLVTSDSVLPFSLAETDFSALSKLDPKNFWGGANDEREQLIARQKILVIHAFQQVGARLAAARSRLVTESAEFTSDDLEIPFTLLGEPDGSSSPVAPRDPMSEWTILRGDAMVAVRALRDGIRLHDGLRDQIDAMPVEPAAPRLAFERQRTQVNDQIKRDRSTVERAIAQAEALGSAEQLRRELDLAVAPSTVASLLQWQARSTRPRFQTMPGMFTE
jgi:hypothetical protein